MVGFSVGLVGAELGADVGEIDGAAVGFIVCCVGENVGAIVGDCELHSAVVS